MRESALGMGAEEVGRAADSGRPHEGKPEAESWGEEQEATGQGKEAVASTEAQAH